MVKNPLANASDMSLIPGLERSLGEGNGNSFQYFFLGNPMHRGVCQATVNGVSKDYVESIHRSQRYHIIRPNWIKYLGQSTFMLYRNKMSWTLYMKWTLKRKKNYNKLKKGKILEIWDIDRNIVILRFCCCLFLALWHVVS